MMTIIVKIKAIEIEKSKERNLFESGKLTDGYTGENSMNIH